jgi:amino acid adenylation domain-containing protein/non-ribosomal peptide synthase protein (TIGR01720 family)
VTLTPIQRWFLDGERVAPHHFNQSMLLEANGVQAPPLRAALIALLAHHDALRLRFTHDGAGWQQRCDAPTGEAPLVEIDLSTLAPEAQEAALAREADRLQACLSLSHGLVRAALFVRGARPARLLLAIHHLVIDGVSWRILLEDLERAYAMALDGEPIDLGPKTSSFQTWADRIARHAPERTGELGFWLAQPMQQPFPLPRDRHGANIRASARKVAIALDEVETRALLAEAPAAYRTRPDELLLTALGESLAGWTGRRTFLVELENHGREALFDDVDLSRTVGWFTATFPLALALGEPGDVCATLCEVKEQLRAVPDRGIGYGLLRRLDAQASRALAAQPQPEICFNYLGQFDAAAGEHARFRASGEPAGAAADPSEKRDHLFEIDAWVQHGRLHLEWTYSEEAHERALVERLASDLVGALRAILAEVRAGAGKLTPSDVPLAGLSQPALDRLLDGDRQVEDLYPLSPAQRGMLFHALYAPTSDVYFEQLSWTFDGPLDAAAFRRAWQETAAHHPILRTAFRWEGLDEPLQLVRPEVAIPWSEHDLRGVSVEIRARLIAKLLEADRKRRFDLALAPLVRLTLVRTGEREHLFVCSHHHLLLDGWSLSRVLAEVFARYQARDGQAPRVEASRPYREYVAWLKRQDLAAAEAWWRKTLRGFRAATPLPAGVPSGDDAHHERELRLSVAQMSALKQLARRHQLTLATLVEGAWALLLSRHSGERDVVFGTVVSGRPAELPGAESMVGMFINTLPVRVHAAPEAELLPWLRALQAHKAELRQLEFSPLADVQGWSDVPRGAPLFDSFFVFENYPIDAEATGGELRARDVRSQARTNYPLTAGAVPGDDLLLKIMYDGRRYDAAGIGRLLDEWRTLLDGMVAQPESRLGALPLLGAAERAQVLSAWNQPIEAPAPSALTLHGLFEAQAARTPDAIALLDQDGALSYDAVERRSNQLAHHLRARGVGPESLVAICAERSRETIVAVLAVLKAGAAYVPIEPSYPSDRIAFMLGDARAAVLLTHAAIEPRLPAHGAQVIRLDADAGLIAHEPETRLDGGATAEHLAYVIYTSGSTGRPKGVMVAHGAVVHHAEEMVRRYALSPSDRLLQFVPLVFDASVEEIFPTLASGAALVLPSETRTLTGGALAALCDRFAISVLHLPPSFWAQWVRDLGREGIAVPASLKTVLVGGEAPDLDALRAFAQLAGARVRFLNAYGPTEATVTATLFETACDPQAIAALSKVPIGRPLAQKHAFVLDEQLEPAPIGAPGHLYLGGVGLARGYLHRPELTAERFVLDPFSDQPGARLYRTGDLARWLPDGNLEFLGRSDDQVKIRGFRIELGEVESVLQQHASVERCAVVARPDPSGGKRLVGYVAGQADPADLRAFLRERLPEYMVPSAFVVRASLPVMQNGKIDRNALPDADEIAPAAGPLVAPATELERLIAAVWQEVLRVPAVGRDDNFFDLGGNSLSIVQVHGKLKERTGRELAVVDLFQYPTVGALAQHLQHDADETPASSDRDRAATRRALLARRRRQPNPSSGASNE